MKVSSILSFKNSGLGYNSFDGNRLYVIKSNQSDSFTFTGNPSKTIEDGLIAIHKGLEKIEHHFSSIDNVKITSIRKNYPKLVARKGQGLTFKIPKYDENLTIIRNFRDKRFIRFSVKNDIKDDFFVFDDNSLVNQTKGLKSKDIEEYINIAREEIERFAEYVSDSVTAKPVSKTIEKAKPKLNTQKVLKTGIADYSKAPLPIQKIMKIFDSDSSKLPKELNAIVSPANNQVLGLSKELQNGSKLSVTKGINMNYGDSLTYLTFKKISPDGSKSCLCVDLNYYKFLMLNRDFKPLVRNNALYEYPETDVLKRHMNERLTEYVDELSQGILPNDIKSVPKTVEKKAVEKNEVKSEKPKRIASKKSEPKETQKVNKKERKSKAQILPTLDNIANNEELLEKIKVKAVQDAQEAANIYFETFKNELQKNVFDQIAKLQEKFSEFFKQLV